MKKETYNKYMTKLVSYAKLHNVDVVYKDLDHEEAEALWIPSARRISIDKKDKTYAHIVSNFLHELGHFSDDHRPKADVNYTNKAYERFNKNKRMTAKQKNRVLLEEKRAWEEGEIIGKKLKFKLGKWYDKYKNEALDDLRVTYNIFEEE